MKWIDRYNGPLRIFDAVIKSVSDLTDDDCTIYLASIDGGDGPSLTVYREELGNVFPPEPGDVVTVLIPKVIKLKKKL